MLAPNTLLQNRYLIQSAVAQGGMGAVYIATDQRLRCFVALKETFFHDAPLLRAFEREAQLLASLRHPALPNVTDHFTENGGQYLVMQYIPGDDLEDMLRREGRPFPLATVLEWADQLLDVLDYLHTQPHPIIHRDIKPKNLKLTARGQVVLLDFGLAKGAAGQMQVSGASKSVLGYTPGYAPLEQVVRADQRWVEVLTITNGAHLSRAQGRGTDARSDLYSLGATVYRLITGQPPKDAPARALSVWAGRPDPLPPAFEANSDVSPAVSEVLARAMAVEGDERFATADEMRHALRVAARPSSPPRGGGVVVVEDEEVSTLIDNDVVVAVECYAETSVGRGRTLNGDNCLLLQHTAGVAWIASDGSPVPESLRRTRPEERRLVFAVADGMDGELAPDVASRMVIETIRDMLMAAAEDDDYNPFDSDSTPAEVLRNAIDYANFAVYRKAQEDPRCSGMGTSLTAAVLTGDALDVLQVGDSRAYVIRDGHVRQITKDQSRVQQLVDVGQLSEVEAETHPLRFKLLQALGMAPEFTPVMSHVRLRRGDAVLLCSGGLWRGLRRNDFKQIIDAERGNPLLACLELVGEANQRGGAENLTALMVAVRGGTSPDGSPITVELPPL
ncbi:MAG TPA: protein kinase [Pyrinomonadaceae bacterium]